MKNIVYNCPDEQTYSLKMSFKSMLSLYEISIVRNAERLIRLETAHFTSKLWKNYNNAGMQATTYDYPYGWGSMRNLWTINHAIRPLNCKPLKENIQSDVKGSGKIQLFLNFPSMLAQIQALCEFLKQHNNDVGDWFALRESDQLSYEAKIKSIKAHFV